MAGEEEEKVYHPEDAVSEAITATGIFGAAGLLVASVQSTLSKQNVGAFGVFTKFGGTIATCTGLGATFAFTKAASANLREKDDHYNSMIGGMLGGSVIGLRYKALSPVVFWAVMTGVTCGVVEYTGGPLNGYKPDPDMDQFEKKQLMRANKRRNAQEFIDEFGEGRGITFPGYEERRAARLKEKYGIDVPKS